MRNNTGSRQTTGIQEELDTTCKQNASRQTTQDNETLFSNWQKESWQTSEETSGLTPWQTYDDDDDEICWQYPNLIKIGQKYVVVWIKT